MNLNWEFLKFQLGNRFGEKIIITQIQPRFVLKPPIRFKFDMTELQLWISYSYWKPIREKSQNNLHAT